MQSFASGKYFVTQNIISYENIETLYLNMTKKIILFINKWHAGQAESISYYFNSDFAKVNRVM